MKDTRSLLLILLSVGLIGTWIYHFYDKTNYSQAKTVYIKDTTASTTTNGTETLKHQTTDSLLNGNGMTDPYPSPNNSDSLKKQLELKLIEINKLKSDIKSILKNNRSTRADLVLARQKIVELQEKVQELTNQNNLIEVERKKLNTLFEQLTRELDKLQQNVQNLNAENENLSEKIDQANIFVVSLIHFTTINERRADEQETSLARRADKFVGSFVLQNNLDDYMNAEVVIVITEPGGSVLQNSAWDSGSFDTKTEGKKNFTRRLRFDYVKGERKRLIFSLDAENFVEGKYVLQIWHSGLLIGETAKILK